MPTLRKQALSQYLRVQCARYLHHSLYHKNAPESMPLPLAARPGVAVFRSRGLDFENQKFKELSAIFGDQCSNINNMLRRHSGASPDDFFKKQLKAATTPPHFFIEPTISGSVFTPGLQKNLSIDPTSYPDISDLRPDVIELLDVSLIRNDGGASIITPRGSVLKWDDEDGRVPLRVVDMKATEQLNSSYAAEVVAYSLALSAWLQAMGLDDSYVVLSDPAIWLKKTFYPTDLPASTESIYKRLSWVRSQLGIADAHLYGPSVLKFLTEDIPNVMNQESWEDLDWGVTPTCSQCDYLGYPPWSKRALADAKKMAKKNGWSREPTLDEYCYGEASNNNLAMQIPNLTIGMRRTLSDEKVHTLPDVALRKADDPVFREHNGLKREAPRLPRKAKAIIDETHQFTAGYQSSQVAAYADLRLTINVNFDAASGMLIALGLGIDFKEPSPKGQKRQNPLARKQVATFFIDRQEPAVELSKLVDFLRTISNIINWIGKPDSYPEIFDVPPKERAKYVKKNTRVQVIFWEERQAKALKEAIGRHLHHLVGQGVLPGAIWLFPPENVVGSDRTADTPPACYLKDMITSYAILPTKINDDLISIAEYLIGFDARLSDYLWDRIGGSIPRERALEIWQEMAPKSPPMSLSQCRQQYERSVNTLVHAMRQLYYEIAINHKGVLRGTAPKLSDLTPTAFRSVAPDALLWLTHLGVEEGTSRLESRLFLTSDPHELEARYVALRTNGCLNKADTNARLKSLGLENKSQRHIFKVRPDSHHVKYRNEESFLTLVPEFPAGAGSIRVTRYADTAGATPPNYYLDHWDRNAYIYLWQLMGADLVYFDRQNNEAVVDLTEFNHRDDCRDDLIKTGALDYNAPMILLNSEGWPQLKAIKDVAKHIGNPPIAKPAPETAAALINMSRKTGRSRIRPAARILWEPFDLVNSVNNVQMAEFGKILDQVTQKWPDKLNPDQLTAAAIAIARQLSLTWGGPGTGKTRTLVATILTDLMLRSQAEGPVRVFITTMTYKALFQIVTRFVDAWDLLPSSFISTLSQNACATFLVGRGRAKEFSGSFTDEKFCGLETMMIGNDSRNTEYANKKRSLLKAKGNAIEIVFGVTRQAYKIGKGGNNNSNADPVVELFDRIWLDESSQLAVSHSLPLLGLLANDGAIGLFGDRLQMPPIQHVPPPKGAEKLVGSLHAYLLHRIQNDEQEKTGKQDYKESFLSINYRSCGPIVAYSRSIGYDQSFEAAYPDRKLDYELLRSVPNWDLGTAPYYSIYETILLPEFPCVAVTYDDGRHGQANTFEAALVAGTILTYRASLMEQADLDGKHFDEGTFWKESVGIVTPHRAQRAAIVSILQAAIKGPGLQGFIDDAVDTVERFQGGEREMIIISFGIGDPDLIQQEEEFLFQKERINVAITRAKSKVVLFVTRDLGFYLPNEQTVVEASKAIKNFVYQHAENEMPIEQVEVGDRSVDLHIRYRTYD